jgi:hypothetical protein
MKQEYVFRLTNNTLKDVEFTIDFSESEGVAGINYNEPTAI